MRAYKDVVSEVIENGTRKENRTGVDTISVFNVHYDVNLQDGFPLLTTKAISWKNIVVEMLWFLSGQTDIGILERHGCKFWDAWADPVTRRVPSAYGNFWRNFPTFDSRHGVAEYNDQIAWVLDELRRNPMSRRLVVSAWEPMNAQTSKLPPCHTMFVLNVQNPPPPRSHHFVHDGEQYPVCGAQWFEPTEELGGLLPGDVWCDACRQHVDEPSKLVNPPPLPRTLHLHLTQRSCDVALGLPYNIASYALLLSIFSHLTGIEVGTFSHSIVDAHIYTKKPDGSMEEYDHLPGLRLQLGRVAKKLPKLTISPEIKSLSDIERLMQKDVTTEEVMRHFVLEGYDPHPAIPFKVAV